MEWEDIPQKNLAFDSAQYLPDHRCCPLCDNRTSCGSSKGQRAIELGMRVEVHFVGECQTGTPATAIAEIACDPERVGASGQGGLKYQFQVAPPNRRCVVAVLVWAFIGVRVKCVWEAKSRDGFDERTRRHCVSSLT